MGNKPASTLATLVGLALYALILSVLLALLGAQSSTPAQASLDAPGDELLIDVQVDESTLAGRTISYTLLVTNTSDLILYNVIITDVWNKQYYNGNFILSGDLQGAAAVMTTTPQPYISWRLPSLPARATGSIIIPMWVSSSLQPTIGNSPVNLSNMAVITHATPGIAGSHDHQDVRVIGPVLSISKSYTPLKVRPGRVITYVLKLTNASLEQRIDTIPGTGVTVFDRVSLYADVMDMTASVPASMEYSPTTRMAKWQMENAVDRGQTVYLSLTLHVSETIRNASDVGQRISNLRSDFGVTAEELPLTVLGTSSVYPAGGNVIEVLSLAGPPPPTPAGTMQRTFPNRVITYFITVYNPLMEPLNGFLVTDTLPQYPLGSGAYFAYSDTFAIAPFAAPTVISTAGKLVAWELPEIAAWGVYTFGLHAYVPTQMDTNGVTGRTLYNTLLGSKQSSVTLAYDNLTAAEGQMKVMPQVVPDLTVVPSRQLPYRLVTYTLSISNNGNTTIRNIWMSDTLPAGFTYYDTLIGAAPFVTMPVVAWQPVTLTAYSSRAFTFRAIANGVPLKTYPSTIDGYSAETSIPTRGNSGNVYLLSPYGVDKTAQPSSFVLGDSLTYEITVSNIGEAPATLSRVSDVLPAGFDYLSAQGPLPIYTNVLTPAVLLVPHTGVFASNVTVGARTLSRPLCNRLPGSIAQEAGAVRFVISSPLPAAEWTNTSPIGNAFVHPHVMLVNLVYPGGATPGEAVTYTLYLTNNTSSNQSQLVITDTLPVGFQFLRMVDFRAPDQVAGTQIIWRGISLSPFSGMSIRFVAQASTTLGDGKENQVQVTSAGNANICVPWLGGGTNNARPGAKVNVRHKQLAYAVSVAPVQVGRLGQVYYKVQLTNIGPYAVNDLIITNVLPFHPIEPDLPFRFVAMQKPIPPEVTQLSTDPPAWRISSLNANRYVQFTFAARVANFPGTYYDAITGSTTSNWTLLPEATFVGAPVEVLDVIAPDNPTDLLISQNVDPAAAAPGDPVTYTLIYSNAGPFAASGIVITDIVPISLTDVVVTNGGIDIIPTGDDNFTWSLAGILGDGGWGVITITGVLTRPLPVGPLTNTAQIANLASGDILTANNTGSASVSVLNAGPTLDPIDPKVVDKGNLLDFTVTASDPNRDPLTFSLDPGAPAGAGIGSGSGRFTWVPGTGQSRGVYTVTVRVMDNGTPALSDEMMFTITVNAVNYAPVAAADVYITPKDTPLNVGAPGVLSNDSDVDGNPMTAILDSSPTQGSLSFQADGSFVFTPVLHFIGPLTFTYRATDGISTSQQALVTIKVNTLIYVPVVRRSQ